jgi:predicted RNA polymerase sigma factor
LAEAGQAAPALIAVEQLADDLIGYQPYHAAHAALLAMTGAHDRAAAAYALAIESAPTEAEARFLTKRLDALPRPQPD